MEPSSHPPTSAPKSSKALIFFFALFLPVVFGILVFVLSIGPTDTRLTCQRAANRCQLTHEFFFGFGQPRIFGFPQSTVTGARVAETIHGVGRATRPPMYLELLFRDGTTYPTIDFGYRGLAQAKADEFNRYLKSQDQSEIALDGSTGMWRTLAIEYGIPVLLMAFVLLIRWLRRRHAPAV